MNAYQNDFMETMNASQTYSKNGNGAFIHSCHMHCEAQGDAQFDGITVGGVSMKAAVSKWWHGTGSDPAINTVPCQYKGGSASPRACNPTCGQGGNFDRFSLSDVK